MNVMLSYPDPNPTPAGSCIAAGYTGCCSMVVSDDCGVGVGVDRCFCDRACYMDNTCCDDIQEVPCLESEWYFGLMKVHGLASVLTSCMQFHW